MRTIAVVTVARSDYGIYQPILHRIKANAHLRLRLMVSGMHLAPQFGATVRQIEADGFAIADRLETLSASDSPEGIAKSIGAGVIKFAQAFAAARPDMLVVLGDRFDMYGAALAALPFKIPIAHIHGGEVTQGAIDDALRHSLTKLSHLHFVSTQAYAHRVEQLGEEAWRITVSGAPALDHLDGMRLLSPDELSQRCQLSLDPPPILVTYHPVTLEYEQTGHQITEVLAALDPVDRPIVFTLPNADTHSSEIVKHIRAFVQTHPSSRIVDNLGTQAYFSMMAHAAVMLGNSSSGIIEAASFNLPVINIGTRQTGRIHGANVLDTLCERTAISAALDTALSPIFRDSLRDLVNPYHGARPASAIIVERLASIPLDDTLITKRFHDLPMAVQ